MEEAWLRHVDLPDVCACCGGDLDTDGIWCRDCQEADVPPPDKWLRMEE